MENKNYLTLEEYSRFIETVNNREDYLTFEILYWCGIRVGELLALTPKDFNFDEQTISIEDKFKKRDRKVMVPASLMSELEIYIKSKGNGRIFTNTKIYLYKKFERSLNASGLQKRKLSELWYSYIALLKHLGFNYKDFYSRIGYICYSLDQKKSLITQSDIAERLDVERRKLYKTN